MFHYHIFGKTLSGNGKYYNFSLSFDIETLSNDKERAQAIFSQLPIEVVKISAKSLSVNRK